MSPLPSLAAHLGGLAWVAVRALSATLLALALAGALLGGLAWYFLRDLPWGWGLLAAVLAFAESLGAGAVLGLRRGAGAAVAHGLRSLRLGGAVVGALFDRLPTGALARSLEQLPLAQVEARLSEGVIDATGGAALGWPARKVQGWLIGAVRRYTLARFREEGARTGGVDLGRVKEELVRTVDDRLADKVRTATRAWTLGVVAALVGVVAGQTWLLHALLSRPR